MIGFALNAGVTERLELGKIDLVETLLPSRPIRGRDCGNQFGNSFNGEVFVSWKDLLLTSRLARGKMPHTLGGGLAKCKRF